VTPKHYGQPQAMLGCRRSKKIVYGLTLLAAKGELMLIGPWPTPQCLCALHRHLLITSRTLWLPLFRRVWNIMPPLNLLSSYNQSWHGRDSISAIIPIIACHMLSSLTKLTA